MVKNYGIIADSRKQSIELTQTELNIAQHLGLQKSKIGRTRPTFGGDSVEKHFLSYCGEIAFCKMMNIYHCALIDPTHNHLIDEGDAVWSGLKVDVKHSVHNKATLAVQNYLINTSVDLYVLMTGTPPVLKYQGAMMKDELMIEANLGNGKKGFEQAFCKAGGELNYYWKPL
jgi:hypothetical protein